MKKPPTITKGKYPNGKPFWLVSCTIPGKGRYKKKHSSELEANKDRAQKMGTVATTISISEMDEARAAILKLKNGDNPDTKGKTLLDAVEFFLANYLDPTKTLPIADYVEEFLTSKRSEGLRSVTILELEKITKEFAQDFHGRNIHEIKGSDIREYLATKNGRNHNRKKVLGQLFNYLAGTARETNRDKPVISMNPVKLVKLARRDDSDLSLVQILTIEETKNILTEAAKFNAQRLFVWLLFTGMRPVETIKFWTAKEPWSQINLPKGIITVNASISKTRSNRQIKIQPNLKAWLEFYAGQSFFTRNWRDKYGDVKKVLGEEKRKINDICRHTFISYLCKITEQWSDVTLQAGNTRDIQIKHYLALIHEDAKDFWAITPEVIGKYDVSEEEYDLRSQKNRTAAILENRKKLFGEPA